MNHETLQALYALDVAEVGEEEAAKRWEYWSGTYWRYNERFPKIIVEPSWAEDIIYRRKPGIPWPKVMQDTKQEWPADAPEWANYMVTKREFYAEMQADWFGMRGVIERPKPAVKKIDWSKLPPAVASRMSPNISRDGPLSGWIAWNCDQDTRGNPLPDGLKVEWYEYTNTKMTRGMIPWDTVTRFRIAGIQEGWE